MDTLLKFMFENSAVRGELVDISATWADIQSRRSYPPAVRNALGEMVAAAALLSANLKFNGSIVMQIHGDGPVKLMVVECDADLHLRGTAKLTDDSPIADGTGLKDLVNVHGRGRFVITLDPKDKLPGQQAYQGIVPLDGDTVATVIEHYMMRSEQLDTRLWLAAGENVSRGLLLQKLPGDGGTGTSTYGSESADDLDAWNRIVMLASTLTDEELRSTEIDTVLRRLFWEETVRVFEPRHPSFQCSCTREKVGNMLRMLGQEEVDSVLTELGQLSIDCDFCGQHYEFDKVDCAQLFATDITLEALKEPGQIRH